MLKLFSLLFFTVVNISNINVFEIEGVFSSGHNNGINRFFEETSYTSSDLFVVQYNATDYTNKAIEELGEILEKNYLSKAVWIGPNETEVDSRILSYFDYVGLAPGTKVVNLNQLSFSDVICESNLCEDENVIISQEEGVYENYMVVGSLGAFVDNLGSNDISSNLNRQIPSIPNSFNFDVINFDINSDDVSEVVFVKPSLAERFYIAISNPIFTYLFFALGFALIGLELFAIGPGLMAAIGTLLVGFSSMVFYEFEINYFGLPVFFISFLVFIKVLSRGYFGILGVTAFLLLHVSGILLFLNYELSVNQWLLLLSSLIIAFFYFVAIPTVIRSRLTTDTSAMTSFVGNKVVLKEIIRNNQALVSLNEIDFVVDIDDAVNYQNNSEYGLSEVDGKLKI